mmetsp:Transcript_25210/g.42531  ORF Transcript_25210/g.42531 Transcript_25210/m.42531 type:complete len:376 (+) Transcript_25210:122-1249(+)
MWAFEESRDKDRDSNQKYRAGSAVSSSARLAPRRIIKLLFALLVVGYSLFVVFDNLHTYSYVWQSTVLADYIYSDLRASCQYDVAPAPSAAELQRRVTQKLKIGIIVLYGKGAVGEWGEDLMKEVMDNRYEYAKLHGYEVINANSHIDPSRPVAWSKLKAVRDSLPRYDYVMYVDMDAVIMQPDIAVERLIYATERGPSADIIMQNDWNGPNTGIWLAKNTAWTAEFLSLAWAQQQLVRKTSSSGVSHPFEYEQRAFHYLLDTEVWRSRALPTYGRDKSAELRTHLVFLPQCAMNSYTLHPLNFKHLHDRKKSQYVEGDFIIHFAGKKGAPKMNLLRHYLALSRLNFQRASSLRASPSSTAVTRQPAEGVTQHLR